VTVRAGLALLLALAGGAACRSERPADPPAGDPAGAAGGGPPAAATGGAPAATGAPGGTATAAPDAAAAGTAPAAGSPPAPGSKTPAPAAPAAGGSKTPASGAPAAGSKTPAAATGATGATATAPVVAQAPGKRTATPPGLGPPSLESQARPQAQPEERAPDAGAARPGASAGRPAALTPAELLAETAQPRTVPGGPDAGRAPAPSEAVGAAPPAGGGASDDDQKPTRPGPPPGSSRPASSSGDDPLPIPGAEITFQAARVRRFLDSGGASLDGRVVDADTDKAVASADIEAWMGTRSVEAETDDLGRFRFEGLIPGSRLTLWITSAPTYVQERTEVVVPEQKPSFQGTFRMLNRSSNPGAVDGGAGLFLSRRGNRTVVTGLAAFGPAERAGVRVNDAIVAVGKRKVVDLGPGAIDYLLRGSIGSPIELTVQSGSDQPRKVLLHRSAR
jgi:hypothetical protein